MGFFPSFLIFFFTSGPLGISQIQKKVLIFHKRQVKRTNTQALGCKWCAERRPRVLRGIFFFSLQQEVQKPQLTCRNERDVASCLSLKRSGKGIRAVWPESGLNTSLCLAPSPRKAGMAQVFSRHWCWTRLLCLRVRGSWLADVSGRHDPTRRLTEPSDSGLSSLPFNLIQVAGNLLSVLTQFLPRQKDQRMTV